MWINATGKRRTTVLDIQRIYSEYTGENVRLIILKLLKEYDISGDRIRYFILDNVSLNDTAIEFILKKFYP